MDNLTPAEQRAQAKREKLATMVTALLKAQKTGDWGPVWDLLGLEPGYCRSCKVGIWWTITAKGARMPLSRAGVSHFADCPNADKHRRRS